VTVLKSKPAPKSKPITLAMAMRNPRLFGNTFGAPSFWTWIRKDPQRARADYLSEWRDDISDFLPMDVLEAATDIGVTQRSPFLWLQ
jgi:hypothetical protein